MHFNVIFYAFGKLGNNVSSFYWRFMNNVTSKFILSLLSLFMLVTYSFAAVNKNKQVQCFENNLKSVIFRARTVISGQLSAVYSDFNECKKCPDDSIFQSSIHSCNAKIHLLKNASWRLNCLINELSKATNENHQKKLCSFINRLVKLVEKNLEDLGLKKM